MLTNAALQWVPWYNLEWRINDTLHLRIISLATFDPALNSAGGKKEFSLTVSAILNKYF